LSGTTITIAMLLAGTSAGSDTNLPVFAQQTNGEATPALEVQPFEAAGEEVPAIPLAPLEAAEANVDEFPEPEPAGDELARPEADAVPADQAIPGDEAGATPSPEEIVLDGSAIVVSGSPPIPGDPLESVNQKSFEAVQVVDSAVIAPVAQGYKKGIPKPVRKGLRNILNNLNEPINFLNFLLQLKPGKAIKSLGRFTINSTIGIGGVMDVAKKKPFNLPHHPNGFGNTLAYYGVGPGPYLFLPLIGSTNVRDLVGRVGDLAVLPTAVGKPFTDPALALSRGSVAALDERVANDEMLKRINESDNPYLSMREFYMEKRKAEIDALHGRRASADRPTHESAGSIEDEELTDASPDLSPLPEEIALGTSTFDPAIVQIEPIQIGRLDSVNGSPAIP